MDARSRLSGTAGVAIAAAVVLPILIGAVFPHPARRALLPATLMIVVVVVVTLVGGRPAGFVAAVVSTASLWYFTLPPAPSVRVTRSDDQAAAVLTGAVSIGLVLVIDRLQRRDRAAVVQRARLEFDVEAQRQAITTLQRALLPRVVPTARGIRIGSYYQTGGAGDVPVGGDWFAFVPLSSTQLGVAIGDVAGHGLTAVAAMAEYRYALRVVATEDPDPAAVLERFDLVTGIYRPDVFTSCVYGVLDADAGTFTFTRAGHPSPILVRDGAAHVLYDEFHGPVVGLGRAARYRSRTVSLQDGDLVVLFTDGLVERRGELIDLGVERLRRRLCELGPHDPHDLDAQCELLVTDLVGVASADDVALVVAHYAVLEPL